MRNESGNDQRDAAVLVTIVGVLVFTPPLLTWWLSEARPWYLPFALWGVLIVLLALVQVRTGNGR